MVKNILKIFICNFIILLNVCLADDIPIAGSVKQVVGGTSAQCAITTDNKLYCWGYNEFGYLGNGTTEDSLIPVQILDDVNFVSYLQYPASDVYTICAIKINGDLYCWGWNGLGLVGNGTTTAQLTPVKILEDVSSVSRGSSEICALKTNGELYCWGANEEGQVGNGTTENQLTPIKVLENVVSVNLRKFSSTICAIKINGDLYCWGYNEYGQVGNGTTENQLTPVKVLAAVSSVSSNGGNTCALKTNGELYCWGNNYSGQVGNGTTEDQTTPVKVLENVSSVTLGWSACAVKTNGDLYCWGANGEGQVGNGTTEDQTTPVKVLGDVSSLHTNREETCVIKTTRELYCWGRNDFGQVGNGTTVSQTTPVQVLTDVVDANFESTRACAVKTDGKLYCWGEGYYVGDGSVENQLTPVEILENIGQLYILVDIVTCAIKQNGALYCWGNLGIPELSSNVAKQFFDGTGDAPQFAIGCSSHWNYANLNKDCTNGIGACLKNGTYGCYGTNDNPSILCNAIAGVPQEEVCNDSDDDCDGDVDEGFGVGDECQDETGIGEYVCQDENNVKCDIKTTFTPTPTPTLTPVPTNVLPVIDVVTPKTQLPLPVVEVQKKAAKVGLPTIVKALLSDNSKKAAKSKYEVTIKKTKRVGKKNASYILGKTYTKLTKKTSVKFGKLDKGTYKIKYRVIITQGKKTKKTKWSKVVTIKVK